MPFAGRALYNLLQAKAESGDSQDIKEWQIRDYRALSIDQLFDGLLDLGVELDLDQFEAAAENVDAPEEIAAAMAPPGEPYEKVYLYIFELWRRLMDDRETISIFCDELDKAISDYEDDPISNGEVIYGLFKELVTILEQNVTLGQKPKTLFKLISEFLSHDLESSIYNYIQDLIEQDRHMAASEITENFMPYVELEIWFELLNIKLMHGVSTEDATARVALFLEKVDATKDLDLYLELLHFLNKTGHKELFESVFVKAMKLVTRQDEYIECLDILFEYFHLNDRKREEKVVRGLLDQIKPSGEEMLITTKEKQIALELVK